MSALHVWPEFKKHFSIPSTTAFCEVGVVEDDVRRLAAQLEGDRLTVAAASSLTRLPARVDPVKEIMSTPGWAAHRLADHRAVAAHQVKHAGGKPHLVDHLGQDERRSAA